MMYGYGRPRILRYKKTFARRIGQRDKAPLTEVLDEIGVEGREFVTDNYRVPVIYGDRFDVSYRGIG